jgi:dimethylaniline monooxygenase (N-oxide forming)
VHLPFIDPEIVPIMGNHVDLYKRIFVPGWPGLCFVRMLNPTTTLNRVFEEQSKVLVHYLRGELDLPSKQQQLDDIAHKNKVIGSVFETSPRHELEELDWGYFDELRRVVEDGHLRRSYGRVPAVYDAPVAGRLLRNRLRVQGRRLAATVGADSVQHSVDATVLNP